MTSEADAIASLVLTEFALLPAKRKPRARQDGTREWVPLSGIVAKGVDGYLKCVALATGMKCLPTSKLPTANGAVLHDWHAEVLAIRAFNHFVLQECRAIIAEGRDSPYIRRRTDEELRGENGGCNSNQPFVWRAGVTLHMYCSEAPCGDASMELTIASQDDPSPWPSPLPPHLMERNGREPASSTAEPSAPDLLLLGRACFSHLGVVRRKPARPDAPPTLSKSCSDKLALKQCTSLLNSLTSLLLSPGNVYLSCLILPYSQFSSTACERCFSPEGRMTTVKAVESRWVEDGYAYRPFEVLTTGLGFEYSRRGRKEATKYVASNLATAWSCNGLAESIIGGVLQGRKQKDVRGASAVSRGRMWALAAEVARLAGVEGLVPADGTYGEVKETRLLAGRIRVKQDVRGTALKGWVRNIDHDDFGLLV